MNKFARHMKTIIIDEIYSNKMLHLCKKTKSRHNKHFQLINALSDHIIKIRRKVISVFGQHFKVDCTQTKLLCNLQIIQVLGIKQITFRSCRSLYLLVLNLLAFLLMIRR